MLQLHVFEIFFTFLSLEKSPFLVQVLILPVLCSMDTKLDI